MMTHARLASLLILVAVAAATLHGADAGAQEQRIRARQRDRVVQPTVSVPQNGSDDPCASWRDNDDEWESFCQVKDARMPAGPLAVDAGRNGGIRVVGSDSSDVSVQAVIRTHARTAERAKQIAETVQIQTDAGQVRATGPDLERREWWSVSFRISTPRQTDLTLNASNGGITISEVSGNITFDTTNGGVRLTDVGGSVRGRTRNGGLTVALNGQSWDGAGLDIETTNGGVNLAIPDGYSAALETRTVNGGFRTDYPITVQGELNARRGISTQLGAGGSPIRVRTTNGGVRITKRN